MGTYLVSFPVQNSIQDRSVKCRRYVLVTFAEKAWFCSTYWCYNLFDGTFGTPVYSGHIKDWTTRDPILSHVLRFTLEGCPMTNGNKELNPYYNKTTTLTVEDGCVFWDTRVVVPPLGRLKLLTELNEWNAATNVSHIRVFQKRLPCSPESDHVSHGPGCTLTLLDPTYGS